MGNTILAAPKGRIFVGKAALLVIQGMEQGSRFELSDQPVALGRGLQNGIRILDTEVSRIHCSIQLARDEYVLSDRNSSNGTFVNGEPIRSKTLANGDQIQVGRTILLFTWPRDDQPNQAEKAVNLVGRPDLADQSSIVGQVPSLVRVPGVAAVEETEAPAKFLANLRTLYQITEEAVRPGVSIDQLLQRILDLAVDVLKADRGCVLLTDPVTRAIRPHIVARPGRQRVDDERMPVSRSIVDYVLRTGQGVRTNDARQDSRFEGGNSIISAGVREAMCVPMQGRNELIGAIYVDTTTPFDQAVLGGGTSRFDEDQLLLLLAIARQAALAVETNRYQQAFVKAERLAAMGQTIATLSHHIKNILQGVRGGSYLIDLGLNGHDEEMVRKGWKIVERNQNKIYHLVMDMLTFSKERRPALRLCQLNEVVQEVVDELQVRAGESGIELRLEASPNVPDCTFDPEGIQRAALNIILNAMDAVEGADHAVVQVETGYDVESDSLWVAIADNGPGIPEEQIERIFNVFESTKGARGTGLGLSVSQKIIREHGGEIAVESRLGEGSRFTLSWPRVDDDSAPDGRTLG